MAEAAADLVGGPYDSRSGFVSFKDEPPPRLMFSLADRDSTTGLVIVASSIDDELTAVYVRVEEKPRKVITYDTNGRAQSQLGVRYRYDKTSPVEALFRRAEHDALLTAEAHEQVMATRRLLLEQSAANRETS